MYSDYENKTVLITGATGFIGGRLAEILVTQYKAKVQVLVRDFSTAMRIARLPIKIFKGDVTKLDEVRCAIHGARFVFHCAYGNKGDAVCRSETDILGTENVLKAAHEEKVRSFVYLSTQSVYGWQDVEWIDEFSPKKPKKNIYGRSKLQAEKIIQRYSELGLNTIIIQPTAVFGPWAVSYGKQIFDKLSKNLMPLINGGEGICNAVYIDDLVHAILASAINERAYSQSFLISGMEYCTWRDFWGYFEKIIGQERTKTVSKKHALKLYKKGKKRPSIIKLFRIDTKVMYELFKTKWLFSFYLLVRKIIPKKLFFSLKKEMIGTPVIEKDKSLCKPEEPLLVFDPNTIDFFTSKTKIKISKAREILNYNPQISLKEGFAMTELWYLWFYNINKPENKKESI